MGVLLYDLQAAQLTAAVASLARATSQLVMVDPSQVKNRRMEMTKIYGSDTSSLARDTGMQMMEMRTLVNMRNVSLVKMDM